MKQVVTAAVTAFVVAIAVTQLQPKTTEQTAAETKESVAERVTRTGVLRCGYNVNPPMLVADANTGEITGFTPDILNRMAELMQIKIEWTEQVGWSEMAAGLIAGRYDLACNGKWIIAMQAALAGVEFTSPLYFTANYAYGRTDETRFDSKLSQLNNESYTIVTMDGAFDYYLADTRYPLAKRVELPALADPATAIENVVTGKADVSFLPAFTADGYMTNNPGKIKKLTPDPVAVFDTAFMFKAGEPVFAAILETSLRQLEGDGFVDATLDKYGIDASATLRVAHPYRLP